MRRLFSTLLGSIGKGCNRFTISVGMLLRRPNLWLFSGVQSLLLVAIAASSVLAQTANEPLTITGPYYQLSTSTGLLYTISGPPGTYQVSGQALKDGTTSSVIITITIPPPGPPPPPPPPPPPVVTGKLWMILVADTNSAPFATAGSFQSRLWGSTSIKDALLAPPVSTMWRHYDIADPLMQTTNWGKVAQKTGYPCLIIVDERGNASPIPMPTDEAGVVAAARRARGL